MDSRLAGHSTNEQLRRNPPAQPLQGLATASGLPATPDPLLLAADNVHSSLKAFTNRSRVRPFGPACIPKPICIPSPSGVSAECAENKGKLGIVAAFPVVQITVWTPELFQFSRILCQDFEFCLGACTRRFQSAWVVI